MAAMMPAELVHMVAEYCVSKYPGLVEISGTDSSVMRVSYKEPVLGNPASPNYTFLRDRVNNWDEFFISINELEEVSELFSSAYDIYREGQRIYDTKNMNLVYLIRTRDEKGRERTYTNDPDSKYLEDILKINCFELN